MSDNLVELRVELRNSVISLLNENCVFNVMNNEGWYEYINGLSIEKLISLNLKLQKTIRDEEVLEKLNDPTFGILVRKN